MYDLTAAHPNLPLGTEVRVTNLRNGRSVVVRINDRGPIVPGRIIDLSYSAARVLDIKARGLQRVRLDIVQQPPQSGHASARGVLTLNSYRLEGMSFDPRERLIVALDVSSASAAQKIVADVGDCAFPYKVGMQLLPRRARAWSATWSPQAAMSFST